MKNFVKQTRKSGNTIINQSKVDTFIDRFNKAIKTVSVKSYTLNTGLDDIPTLDEDEFDAVCKQAKDNGYLLIRYDDNYTTTTYKLSLVGLN